MHGTLRPGVLIWGVFLRVLRMSALYGAEMVGYTLLGLPWGSICTRME